MDGPLNVSIQKNVVLLGAGNAHLRFVRMFGMQPWPGVAITLVSEAPVIPYSAMVPGHLGGDYSWDEITIDLVRLCRAVNVRFVSERASGIDGLNHKVLFATRPELSYDVLSLGLGSIPVHPPGLAGRENSWPMRPLATLIKRLDTLQQQLQHSSRPFHLVVVGGGASGCELTLAIQTRFATHANFRLTLLQGDDRLLPQFSPRASHIFAKLLAARGITVRLKARVSGGDDKTLELDGKERLEYDAVLWATNGSAPDLLRTSGLQLDKGGFLLVNDTLQSVRDPAVFGTGDCISLVNKPNLAKNGVYAVRQGAVLFDNLRRFLTEQPLREFRPQRYCLNLLNTSDGSAVFTYGSFVWRGRLARWLKDRIDRAWINKFTHFTPMVSATAGEEESVQMRCGGCGSKISGDVLSAVLKRIDPGEDSRILLGAHAGEDASVHRVRPELFGPDSARLVEVQTIDYFKAFVDDPYLFGQIAALNAVSDLYAMNARPFVALAMATLPYARGPVQEAMLFELMSGAIHSLRQLGVVLTGGHTTEGNDLALGFAVTGYAEEDELFQKGKLQVGDRLILTKPLGSGALLAAWMRAACPARWFTSLIKTMLLANNHAAKVFAQDGVRACTDVTGFGLAGHLLEMLDASNLVAKLDSAQIPLYDGFTEIVSQGIVSSLHQDNAKSACRIQGPQVPPAWLFDPQTSGGLLAAVKPARQDEVLRALIEAGYKDARAIGEVSAKPGDEPPMIHLS